MDPAKGTAGGLILITVLLAAAGLSAVAAGRACGWIPAAVAVVLLPADVWALHWFARSIHDEGEPTLPDPDLPTVPEPTSNVRTPPRRTDPA